jgi:hypothetical protein
MFGLGTFILDMARWAGRHGVATPTTLVAALRAANGLGRAGIKAWQADHQSSL